MYLFIDGERKTDFSKEKDELKKIFPHAFGTNPQPILINQADNSGVVVTVFKKGDIHNPLRNRVQRSPATLVAAKGKFIGEDGMTHEWILTDKLPKLNKAGDREFSAPNIAIAHATQIDGTRDIEKLVGLYYYSGNFRNGKQGKKNAKFEFVIPSVASAKRIESVNAQAKFTNALLVESSRMSYDKVKEIYASLGLNLTGIEEDDRLALFDYCIQNANGFVERYERAIANIEALDKANRGSSMTDINALITKAKKAGALVEEDGFWVLKNENGGEVEKVVEVRGDKAQAKNLALAEFLAVSPVTVDTITALVG